MLRRRITNRIKVCQDEKKKKAYEKGTKHSAAANVVKCKERRLREGLLFIRGSMLDLKVFAVPHANMCFNDTAEFSR